MVENIFSDNGWFEGACVDSSTETQTGGVSNLGKFKDRAKCLSACKTFAKTGCEHDTKTKACLAHSKNVEYQETVVADLTKDCFKIKSKDGMTS